MSDDLENLELEFEFDSSKTSENESSKRQTIMRQLFNELVVINNALERERNHPFSSLEVIIEEVTPCSSSQQLENNISVINAGLQTHAQVQDLELESATDSDEEVDSFQNTDSLKDMVDKNMYFIKKQRTKVEKFSDESTTSAATGRTFNDSNTSNIDGRNGDSDNGYDSKELTYNKRKCTEYKSGSQTSEESDNFSTRNYHNVTNYNKDRNKDFLQKYDLFINDDDRYIQKEQGNSTKKSKFSTLNKNYEHKRFLNFDKKSASTSNIPTSDKENDTYLWAKKTSKYKKFQSQKLQLKLPPYDQCSSPESKSSLEKQKVPLKKDQKYCGDCTFTCLNTYVIKTTPKSKFKINRPILPCNNKQQELITQRVNIEDKKKNCLPLTKTLFNLDMGDGKSKDNLLTNSIDKIGQNESLLSIKDNKSVSNCSVHSYENENTLSDEQIKYTGTLIVVKKSNRDIQENEDIDHHEIQHLYPKIIYPSISRNIATQVSDADWKKICQSKRAMSEHGSLRLNLPNSSDDDMLEGIESEEQSDFKQKTTIISDCSNFNSKDSSPIYSIPSVKMNKLNKNCCCFPCCVLLRD